MVLFKWPHLNGLVSKKPKCLYGLLMSFIHPNRFPKTVGFPNNEVLLENISGLRQSTDGKIFLN